MYARGCDDYLRNPNVTLGNTVGKLRTTLDALQGRGKDPSGAPFESASGAVAKLRRAKVEARIEVPEKGVATIRTKPMEAFKTMAASPPTTAAEKKRFAQVAKQLSDTQPATSAISQHLYSLWDTHNQLTAIGQSCSAYPLASAVMLVNLQRQGYVDDDRAAWRAGIKKVIASSMRARAASAGVMAVYANYQAAVAGALAPETLDATIDATRRGLDGDLVATDADADQVLQIAEEQIAAAAAHDAELKALADRSKQPSSATLGGAASAGGESTAGGVLGLLRAVVSGSPLAIARSAAKLLPKDNPVASAFAGAEAIASGDYRAALNAAEKLSPEGSSLKGALGTTKNAVAKIDSAFDTAKSIEKQATELKSSVTP